MFSHRDNGKVDTVPRSLSYLRPRLMLLGISLRAHPAMSPAIASLSPSLAFILSFLLHAFAYSAVGSGVGDIADKKVGFLGKKIS